jgi:beta-glucosidase
VVSDYNAWLVYGTHRQHHPKTPDLRADEAIACFRAGMDLPLHHSADLLPRLVTAVKDGRLPMEVLDAVAGRMLRAKFLLGVFDQPYAEPERAARVMHSAEHQALAKRSALAGLTLLRNDNSLLPLDPARIKRLGVAGPHADKVKLGGYSRGPISTDSKPLSSLRLRYGAERVVHLTGSPEDMAKAAAGCDAIIYCAGVKEGEATDRGRFDLPGSDASDQAAAAPEAAGTAIIDKKKQDPLGNQVAEVRALGATGIPVVLCLVAGSPVGLGPVENSIRAALVTWYGGEAGGQALAEVIAGDAAPGGRLPMTWPRHAGQIPIYHDLYPSGRGGIHYGDIDSKPQYPFGHGLGYTTFAISDLKLESSKVPVGEPIRFTVQVANTGSRAGAEVVQVYLSQRIAARVLPLQRLEAYLRVELAPGERRTVQFELGPDHLGWYDADGVRHLDPGTVELRVGKSAADLPLKATVTIP